MSHVCTDKVIGDILAGWRYDISGLATEMRGDYEQHLAECGHCRSRQVLHRTIDIGLMIVATVSAGRPAPDFRNRRPNRHASSGAPRKFTPRGASRVTIKRLFEGLNSFLTPNTVVVADVARIHARRLHDRLPSQIRERLPESMRSQEKVG